VTVRARIEDGELVIETDDVRPEVIDLLTIAEPREDGIVEISLPNDQAVVRDLINSLVPVLTRLQFIDRVGIGEAVGPEGL
jgi:hypothetical protein